MTIFHRISLLSQFCLSFLFFLSLSVAAAPSFIARPAPNLDVFVGESALGHPVTTAIAISNFGDALLQLSSLNNIPISGADAQDFQLLTALPLQLSASRSSQLIVQCTPREARLYTAHLSLTSNDPNYPDIFYPLYCQGLADAARYQSQPEAHRGLFIMTDALGVAGTAGIRFFEIGTADLQIDPDSVLLEGPHAADFQVLNPFPLTIADGQAAQTLVVQCKPTSPGLRAATLKLLTNVPAAPRLIYPLGCIGDYTTNAAFASFPAPNTNIGFTPTQPGKASRTWLSLFNQGARDSTVSRDQNRVSLSNIRVTGTHAADFTLHLLDSTASFATYDNSQLLPVQDLDLFGKSPPRQLAITCTPTDLGERVATLSLQTSDPNHSSVDYALRCPSDRQEPPDDIMLSNNSVEAGKLAGTVIGTFSTVDRNINDSHSYRLLSDSSPLFGLSANQLVLVQTTLTAATHSINVRSTDSSGNSLDKTFEISVTPSVPDALFEAQAFSEIQGLLVDTLDTPELFSLTGIIQPPPSQLGLNAELYVIYTYKNINNQLFTLAPISLGTHTLTAPTEVPLYRGNLLFLPGVIEVELGYTLSTGETQSGLAKVLNINQNSPPSRILLDTQQVAENSPVGTLVGTLETLDGDLGDSFTYAIVNNPGAPLGYFEIVGEQLRIANSFPLSFQDTPRLNLTLRSIDSSGAFVDERFVLEVIDQIEVRFLGELRSAGTLLPNSPDTVPTVRGDYPLTLTARILPESSHIGKTADIYYQFSFDDGFGEDNAPPLVGILDSGVTLTELMDYPLFAGATTELSGTAQVKVGYRLLDGSGFDANDVIAAFSVAAESALQASWNTLDKPACGSQYSLPAVLDLSSSPADFAGASLLQQINAMPQLQEAGLVVQQDALNNTLLADLGGTRLAWWVLSLRQDYSTLGASLAISSRQTLKLFTDTQLEIIAQPAVHEMCAFLSALSQAGYSDLQVNNNGNIHFSLDANHFISTRPDVALSDTTQTQTGFFISSDSLASWVFNDTQNLLKQQMFYASPAWAEQLAAQSDTLSFDTAQQVSFTLHGHHYRGIPALHVERGTSNTAMPLQVEALGDMNGDGVDDFALLYNNGDKQVFYAVAQ